MSTVNGMLNELMQIDLEVVGGVLEGVQSLETVFVKAPHFGEDGQQLRMLLHDFLLKPRFQGGVQLLALVGVGVEELGLLFWTEYGQVGAPLVNGDGAEKLFHGAPRLGRQPLAVSGWQLRTSL